MQISYHSALTKIQKLQNLKKKKKTFFFTSWYCPKLAGPAGIFSGTKQGGYTYRFAWYGTVYSGRTGRYGTELTPLILAPVHRSPLPLSYAFVICLPLVPTHSWP